MKRKTVIVVCSTIIVLLIASGLFAYRYYASPEYSLHRIKTAYEEHDLVEFEKYVDIKTLVGGILDNVLNEFTKTSTATTNAEKLGEDLGKGIINLLRPQVEDLWVQQIHRLVEIGELQSDKGQMGLDQLWIKNDSGRFKQVKHIQIDGKVATIELEFSQPRFDTALVLNVRMRDKGNYWQLFDISNILELIKTIENLEEKRVHRLNKDVENEFFKNVSISEPIVTSQTLGYYNKYYHHTYNIEFKNVGQKTVDSLTCIFDIVDGKGKGLESGYAWGRVDLKPGAVYRHKEEDYMSYTHVDSKSITLKVQAMGLTFDDGTQLKWHRKWEDIE